MTEVITIVRRIIIFISLSVSLKWLVHDYLKEDISKTVREIFVHVYRNISYDDIP